MEKERLMELAGIEQLNEAGGSFLVIKLDKKASENSESVIISSAISPEEAMAKGVSKHIEAGRVSEELIEFIRDNLKKGKEFYSVNSSTNEFVMKKV